MKWNENEIENWLIPLSSFSSRQRCRIPKVHSEQIDIVLTYWRPSACRLGYRRLATSIMQQSSKLGRYIAQFAWTAQARYIYNTLEFTTYIFLRENKRIETNQKKNKSKKKVRKDKKTNNQKKQKNKNKQSLVFMPIYTPICNL